MKIFSRSNTKVTKIIAGGLIAAAISINPGSAQAAAIKDIDLSSSYARQSIINLAEKGIIAGNENGHFNPLQAVRRPEMVKMIVKAMDIDTSNLPDTPTFKDVPKNHWAYEFVEAACREGIIKGSAPGIFGVNAECTREEMAVMFVRSLGLSDDEIKGKQEYVSINKLADRDGISAWARESVAFVLFSGLMKGNGDETFGAKQAAERQQVAVVTDRFLTNKEKIQALAKASSGEAQYPELFRALWYNNLHYKGRMNASLDLNATNKLNNQIEEVGIDMDMSGARDGSNVDLDVKIATSSMGQPLVQMGYRTIKLGDRSYTKYSNSDKWTVETESELEQSGALGSQKYKEFLKYYDTFSIEKVESKDIDGAVAKYAISDLNGEAVKSLLSLLLMPIPGTEEINSVEEILNNGYECKAEIYLNDKNQVIHEKYVLTGNHKDEESGMTTDVKSVLEADYYDIEADIEIEAPVQAETPAEVETGGSSGDGIVFPQALLPEAAWGLL